MVVQEEVDGDCYVSVDADVQKKDLVFAVDKQGCKENGDEAYDDGDDRGQTRSRAAEGRGPHSGTAGGAGAGRPS
jgi:hypothetical protein